LTESELIAPEERRAQDSVRSLRAALPDPKFLARLSREFAGGAIPAPRRPAALPRAARAWLGGGALAAAVALIAAVVLTRPPAWRLVGVEGDGIAILDGRPVPLAHTEELASRLRPGLRIRVPEGATLEIASAGTMDVRMLSGADFTVPRLPSLGWSKRTSCELRGGELRITTGRRFRGTRMAIETPEAAIEVTGTTLAVICDPEGTCVCVLEGRVRVGPKGGDMASVAHGMRRFVFNDARAPESGSMREEERVPLRELSESFRGPAGPRPR
jgi:hypothetical protein